MQAEGFAYARAVLPAISRINGGGASAVQATFDLFGQPSESQAEAVSDFLQNPLRALLYLAIHNQNHLPISFLTS